MNGALITLISLFAGFLYMIFYSKKAGQENADIVKLKSKIEDEKAQQTETQKTADEKTKEYQDALKIYDPNFHSDDTGDGKPGA